MPTGYVHKIEGGCTFEEFVMGCARAFDALVHMRNSSSDAEIPVVIKPSDYHAEALVGVEAELKKVLAMSPEEIDTARKVEFEAGLRDSAESDERRVMQVRQYNCMLAQVHDWKPPTSAHRGLKDFMIEQIKISVPGRYGYDAQVISSAEEWVDREVIRLHKDIAYHTKHNDAEIKRCRERTRWVKDLRDSLGNGRSGCVADKCLHVLEPE